MKTIFITIFEGSEARNILRTPIFEVLKKTPDVRLVFLTKSEDKKKYYEKDFSGPNIVYEVAARPKVKGLDKIFASLKFSLLRTETMDLRRRMRLEDGESSALYYWLSKAFNRFFARPFFRKIIRFLDFYLVRNNFYSPYFEKYKPDLIFMAHLFDEPEIHLLREAKIRRVKTVGFVNSWDKVTARCIMRLLPDKAIVFNDIVKKEMMEHNEMHPKDIFVAGLPQYDLYFTGKPSNRKYFFDSIGIDPQKKLIVYAPNGRYSGGSDGAMIDLLHSLTENGELEGVEMLVRFQPNDIVDNNELKVRPWLKYQIPGIRFSATRGVDWDMSPEDNQILLDTLFYADLFICYTSSLSIDAAVFDKPVINIKFELGETNHKYSPTRFYQMAHYKNAVDSGGICVVNSKIELAGRIKKYLGDPEMDRAGRRRLIAEQVKYSDGRSGERIGKFILELLHSL